MWRGQDEGAVADPVALVAEDGGAVGREVGDLLVVLLVLGVAEEHGALDLVLDGGLELQDGAGDDGGALAVKGGEGVLVRSLGLSGKEKGDIMYLYPPVTMEASGHFSWARVKRRMASSMASWLVPLGSILSPRAAS